MNRQNYAFAILHELFHVDEVAMNATGVKTEDFAYGAWNVLELASGNIKNETGHVLSPLGNADTFAWFAMVSTLLPFSMLFRNRGSRGTPGSVSLPILTPLTHHNSIST